MAPSPKQQARDRLATFSQGRQALNDIIDLVKLSLQVYRVQRNREAQFATQRAAQHAIDTAKGLLTQPGKSRALRQTAERALVLAELEGIKQLSELINPGGRWRAWGAHQVSEGASQAGLTGLWYGPTGAEAAPTETEAVTLDKVWQVVQAGPEVLAALGTRQVAKLHVQVQAQQDALATLNDGIERFLSEQGRVRRDPLWASLVRNREGCMAFLRLAKANLKTMRRHIAEHQAFDTGRYRAARSQVTAAQGALTEAPEGIAARRWIADYIRGRQAAGELPDWWAGLFGDEPLPEERRIEEAQRAWGQLAGQIEVSASEEAALRALLQDAAALEGDLSDEGTLAGLSGLVAAADLRLALQTLHDGHRPLAWQLQSLLRLEGQLQQAQRTLGPLDEDLAGLIEQIDTLEEDIIATRGRLALQAAIPGWTVRVGMVGGVMDTLFGDEVLAALEAARPGAEFEGETKDLVEYIRDSEAISLLRGDPPPSLVPGGTGGQIIADVELLRSGSRAEHDGGGAAYDLVEETIANRMRAWQAELRVVGEQLTHLARALSRVRPVQHPLVDDLFTFLGDHQPALDGAQWLLDRGWWGTLLQWNTGGLGQAGVLAHQVRSLLQSGLQDLPKVSEYLGQVIAWLDGTRADLYRELEALDPDVERLNESIEGEGRRVEEMEENLDGLQTLIAAAEESLQRNVDILPDTAAEGTMTLQDLIEYDAGTQEQA